MKRLFLLYFVLFHVSISLAQVSQAKFDSLVNELKLLRSRGEFDSAITQYHDLLKQVPAVSKNTAYLFNVLGVAYRSIGNKELRLKYIYEAINLNKELKDERNLAKNYINLAIYYGDEGQETRSKGYLLMAEDLITDKRDLLLGYIYNSLGIYYNRRSKIQIQNVDTATNYYLRALQLYKDNQAVHLMPMAYNNIAINYNRQGKLDFAKDNFFKAIKIADSLNNHKSLVSSYRNLGWLYMEEKNYVDALDYYQKSLALSYFEKNPKYKIDIYSNLVNANIAVGNVDEAAKLFKKFNQLRDSIYDVEKIKQLKELETKYETDLKEQEIKDQQMTIAAKNFQKNIFLSLTILMIILIIAAIWFFRQKQKYLRKLKNEEIANMKKEQELKELSAMMHGQEEERNRIANDLHDRLGARLSSIKLLFQNKESLSSDGDQLVKYIDEAIKETREISHNLSSDMLTRFGLQTALKDAIRTIQESNQLQADLVILGMDERWPLEVERNIFYTLLELINNTLRHSGAKAFIVQIIEEGNDVNIFYEDDGKGFDKNKVNNFGLGMRSLKARLNSIEAEITIDTKPNTGFNAHISFSIPLINNEFTNKSIALN